MADPKLKTVLDLDVDKALRDVAALGKKLDKAGKLELDAKGLKQAQREADRLAKALRDADKSAEGLGDETAKVGSNLKTAFAAIGTAAVVKGITDTVAAAVDLEESASKAATVFKDSFGIVEQASENAVEAVALSKGEYLAAASTVGNLLTAQGLTAEAAADMSVNTVQLAADLASFNNIEVDDALEKLRAGLTGEAEPLKALGAGFNQAELDAKAAELGFKKVNGALSEGDKVAARYALIVQKTADAQGDMARTGEGLANQQKKLRAEIVEAQEQLGAVLIPVFLELVGVAREDLLPALVQLGEALGPVLAAGVGSLGRTLKVATPLLRLLATIIESIPTPLLEAATAFVLLNKGMTALKATKAATMFAEIITGAGSAKGALAGLGSQAATTASNIKASLAGAAPLALAAGGLIAIGQVQAAIAESERMGEEYGKDFIDGFTNGVSTGDISNAAQLDGLQQDLDEAKAKAAEYHAFWDKNRGRIKLNAAFERILPGEDKAAGVLHNIEGAIGATADLNASLNALRGNVAGVVDGLGDMGIAASPDDVLRLADSLGIDLSTATDDVKQRLIDVAAAQRGFGDDTADTTGDIKDQAQATQDLVAVTRDLIGVRGSALQSEARFQAELAGAAEELKASKFSLDLTTEAGRKTADTFLGVAQAGADLAAKQEELDGNSERAAATLQSTADAVIALAAASGASDEEIQILLYDLGLLDKADAEVLITAKDRASGTLNDIARDVSSVDGRSARVTVTTENVTVNRTVGSSGGGYTSGSGSERYYHPPGGGRIPLANGGIISPRAGGVPATIAEAGHAEAVIPLDPSRSARALQLLNASGLAGRVLEAAASGAGPTTVTHGAGVEVGQVSITTGDPMHVWRKAQREMEHEARRARLRRGGR